MTSIPDDLESDYFRKVLRHPPDVRQTGAHFVWLRLMSQMLLDVEEWAPHFAYALCADRHSLDYLSQYGSSGYFERTYSRGIPHILSFVEYFLESPAEPWLKDLARVEAWHSAHKMGVGDGIREQLSDLLQITQEPSRSYTIVGCDVLSVLQSIVGYRATTMSRVAHLLWMLGISPVRLLSEPSAAPGIIVFETNEEAINMTYVPA